MSYNISQWKTKKIENLHIPLEALYDVSDDLASRGWQLEKPTVDILSRKEPKIRIEVAEDGEISGTYDIASKLITVEYIRIRGEASGTFFEDIVLPALKESTGVLEAVLIWEHGDSIEQVTVRDGVVERREIEL